MDSTFDALPALVMLWLRRLLLLADMVVVFVICSYPPCWSARNSINTVCISSMKMNSKEESSAWFV
jgi:hypothetical protein